MLKTFIFNFLTSKIKLLNVFGNFTKPFFTFASWFVIVKTNLPFLFLYFGNLGWPVNYDLFFEYYLHYLKNEIQFLSRSLKVCWADC